MLTASLFKLHFWTPDFSGKKKKGLPQNFLKLKLTPLLKISQRSSNFLNIMIRPHNLSKIMKTAKTLFFLGRDNIDKIHRRKGKKEWENKT